MLVFAVFASGGCGNYERPPALAPQPPPRDGVTARVRVEGERIEGEVLTAALALENPGADPLVVAAWEILLDGAPLAGSAALPRVRADDVAEDPESGSLVLRARWIHDDMPIAAGRERMMSLLQGRADTSFRRADIVVPARSTREWTARFTAPLGASTFRIAGRVILYPAGGAFARQVFVCDTPDALDPDEAWKRWSARLPNPPPGTDPDPEEPVTLRFARAVAAPGALVRDSALAAPCAVGEEAGWPLGRREFTLDAAAAQAGIRGTSAWCGAWVISDGSETAFVAAGTTTMLSGNHVDTFRAAWLFGLATFFSDAPFHASLEEAFGPSGPMKGGGYAISVQAARLAAFAAALAENGFTLKGQSVVRR
jgi:hypothetical protein